MAPQDPFPAVSPDLQAPDHPNHRGPGRPGGTSYLVRGYGPGGGPSHKEPGHVATPHATELDPGHGSNYGGTAGTQAPISGPSPAVTQPLPQNRSVKDTQQYNPQDNRSSKDTQNPIPGRVISGQGYLGPPART